MNFSSGCLLLQKLLGSSLLILLILKIEFFRWSFLSGILFWNDTCSCCQITSCLKLQKMTWLYSFLGVCFYLWQCNTGWKQLYIFVCHIILTWRFTICVAFPSIVPVVYLMLVWLTITMSPARVSLSVLYTVWSHRYQKCHYSQNQWCTSNLNAALLHALAWIIEKWN